MEVYMFQAKKIRAWGKRVQGMFVTRSPLRLNTRGTHLEWNHRCVYTKSGASKNLCWFQSLPVNWIKFNRDSQPICLSTIFPSHKITVLSWRILKQHLYWPTTRCLPQANEKLSSGQFLEDHEGMLMTQKAFTWKIPTLFGILEASESATPMHESLKVTGDMGADDVDATFYEQIVGELLYLANTRPGSCQILKLLTLKLQITCSAATSRELKIQASSSSGITTP